MQYIRTAAIIQLLLGNIGRPGGGILALRGHASIQGSTDMPTLYDLLPGYLPMPKAGHDATSREYLANNALELGWWSEFPKYAVSLLKAWCGEHATGDERLVLRLPAATDRRPLPHGDRRRHGGRQGPRATSSWARTRSSDRCTAGCSAKGLREARVAGRARLRAHRDRGVLASDGSRRRVRDIDRGVLLPRRRRTRRRTARYTNTQRLLQWHHKAVEPPGDCRSELWFMYHLGRRLRALYAARPMRRTRRCSQLTWDYPTVGTARGARRRTRSCRRSTATRVADGSARRRLHRAEGRRVDARAAAGSTPAATRTASTRRARRKPAAEQTGSRPSGAGHGRRTAGSCTTAASADPDGKPWSERKAYVWWDDEQGKWTGHDVPDFIADRPPSYRPSRGRAGTDDDRRRRPVHHAGGRRGWLYAPDRAASTARCRRTTSRRSRPFDNLLYAQQCNPARMEWRRRDNPYHRPFGDPRYPYVITTYRLTEHHTAGGMSRWLPWLSELQPEMFCEVSPELAAERGLRNGGWATITTARAEIECRVLVTERIAAAADAEADASSPDRASVPLVGTAWSTGDTVNELIALVADPNVSIQESKALTADIRPGRTARRNAEPRLRWPPDESRSPQRAGTGRVLHRHDALHRVQGVRGGVQAVEPVARRRAACSPACRTTTPCISARRPGATSRSSSGRMVENTQFSWLMMSDVCKHCERAACLDACPTGSIIRTEFDTVFVQPDICNGCGYCVSACPFGVIDRREDDGRAWKCTLCYDRLDAGMTPACAKACPTESIQFGDLDELRARAGDRVASCTTPVSPRRTSTARARPEQPGTDGLNAFFLLTTGRRSTTCRRTRSRPRKTVSRSWRSMAAASAVMGLTALVSVLGRRR